MSSPVTSTAAIKRLLRRFRRSQRGSAAVEFAFIAPMFFALIFAIIETALMFFAGQVLETGTQDSARLMYTHQAQDSGMTQAQFKDDLCARVAVLFSCAGITISAKSYAPGVSIPSSDLADPITSGSFAGSPSFQSSNPGDTVLVRTYYQWPLFVTGLGYNIANLGSGSNSKRLLAATAAFRVEP